MAVVTINASDVDPQGLSGTQAPCGELISAGDLLYLDASSSNVAKKCDNSSQARAACVGMAVNSTSKVGQPVCYVRSGEVAVTAASFAGVGRALVVSETAGKMAPESDLVAGKWVTHVGYSSATGKLVLEIVQTGLQWT